MNQIVFKPRIFPHNPIDAVLAVVIGIVQACVLFIAPAIIVAFVTHSPFLGLVTGLVLYALFFLFVVHSVSLNSEGISFRRVLGNPRFLNWQSITAVTIPSRREIIWNGWLWPMFPPREASPCLSCLNHVRFDWTGGYCYFPPSDLSEFLKEIETFRKLNDHRPA